MKRKVFLIFFAGLLLVPAPAEPQDGRLPVIASIFPVADMVRRIGGDSVEVATVIPPGASPHTFDPKPSLVKTMASARLFFMVGAGLEFWAEKFTRLSETSLMTVTLSEGLPLIDLQDSGGGDHRHLQANPHIWLDPVLAMTMVSKISDALCNENPALASVYQERTRQYLAQLRALDATIRQEVDHFRTKRYVAFHPVWEYFARRYGLESAGIIEISPGKAPGPRHLEDIVSRIEKYQIHAVFAEPQLNPRIARVVASEAGVRVLFLDPIGSPELPGRNSYIAMMTYNLAIMKEAME